MEARTFRSTMDAESMIAFRLGADDRKLVDHGVSCSAVWDDLQLYWDFKGLRGEKERPLQGDCKGLSGRSQAGEDTEEAEDRMAGGCEDQACENEQAGTTVVVHGWRGG